MAFAGAVAGIDEDGQVAAFLYRGNDGEIKSVAGEIGEGADAALAENDVVVAFAHDVFGGHQEFVESGGHAAFEEHGFFGAAGTFEQRKILHVACADLDDVGVFIDEVERFVVDGFGDDAKTVGVADFSEDFEASFAQTLKAVRRSARLVGASTKEADAGGLELRGGGQALLFGFDSAGSSNHGEMRSTDEDVSRGSGNADNGVFLLNVATDQFVGLGDGNAFDDAGHGFENAEIDGTIVAGDADGGAASAGNGVGLEAESLDAVTDVLNLLFGGVGLHND